MTDTNTLRDEIIRILITEWHFTEAQALNHIKDEACYNMLATSRRKYHFKRALGKVDQFTPSFPRLYAGDAGMFATDESANYWLSQQTWHAFTTQAHYQRELDRRGSQNAETRSVTKARHSRRASYSNHARPRAERAYAASV